MRAGGDGFGLALSSEIFTRYNRGRGRDRGRGRGRGRDRGRGRGKMNVEVEVGDEVEVVKVEIGAVIGEERWILVEMVVERHR